jgi:hypothetical protein
MHVLSAGGTYTQLPNDPRVGLLYNNHTTKTLYMHYQSQMKPSSQANQCQPTGPGFLLAQPGTGRLSVLLLVG